jgi:hypothetical protein
MASKRAVLLTLRVSAESVFLWVEVAEGIEHIFDGGVVAVEDGGGPFAVIGGGDGDGEGVEALAHFVNVVQFLEGLEHLCNARVEDGLALVHGEGVGLDKGFRVEALRKWILLGLLVPSGGGGDRGDHLAGEWMAGVWRADIYGPGDGVELLRVGESRGDEEVVWEEEERDMGIVG